MAKTITTTTYLDDITGLLNGETFTINGGHLIIRTDTRWHANAPAGMVGHIAGNNVISATLGGKITIDGTQVRWVSFNNGSNNVPSIGSTIFWGGGDGYLLGVYDGLKNAPLTPGTAMPSTGWIKFREISGTLLSGTQMYNGFAGPAIGTTTEDARVGWIEVMASSASNFNVPRLGTFTVLGDWFELGITNGTAGQQLQIPTNGGGTDICPPGVWIESSPGNGDYEFWPNLSAASNAWLEANLRYGDLNNDKRGKFVKCLGSGTMQIGETVSRSGTYAQNVTAATYSVSNNIVTVTSNAHGMAVGENVRLSFTSGPLSGTQTVAEIETSAANTFSVTIPSANGSGNVTHSQRCTIKRTAHGLPIGALLSLQFSADPAANGEYKIIATPTADTYVIEGISLTSTSGSVTENVTIGYVPPAGCKVRIPNVFGWECNTTSGNVTIFPNATLTTRPDFTVSGGYFDINNFYTSWYLYLPNPYYVKIKNTATHDTLYLVNTATEFVIDNVGVGIYLNASVISLNIQQCKNGGKIYNSVFFRNTAAASGFSLYVYQCSDIDIDNVKTGVIAYGRSTGYCALYNSYNIMVNNLKSINASIVLNTVTNAQCTNLNYTDRLCGVTNATSPMNAFQIQGNSYNIIMKYLSCGIEGVKGNSPYGALINVSNSEKVRVGYFGSFASPYRIKHLQTYAPQYIFSDTGGCRDVKIFHVYINLARTYNILTHVTSKNITLQHIYTRILNPQISSSSTIYRSNMSTLYNTAISNVYGSNWMCYMAPGTNNFNYSTGNIKLLMYEPNADTTPYVNVIQFGPNAGFTSNNSVAIPNLNDEVEFITPYYIKGYDSFQNVNPTLSGTNTGNFTITYSIDKGTGTWSAYKALTGANLSGEGSLNINPGFKLKIRIKTTTANATNALNYIILATNTSYSTQQNFYADDENPHTLTFNNLTVGTEIVIYYDNWTEMARVVSPTSTYVFNFIYDSNIGTRTVHYLLWHANKQVIVTKNFTLGDQDYVVNVSQVEDLVYTTSITEWYRILPSTKQIEVDINGNYSVPQAYSVWKNWIRSLNEGNPQYDLAFEIVGGNNLDGTREIPKYTKLINGWKVLPPQQSYTMRVYDGFLFADGDGDPFVTQPGYTLRIVYDQPVWALALNTNSGGLTAADVWNYSNRTLTSGLITPADVWSYGTRTLTDASIVRTELATELARIDVPVSSRLAESSYTAPDNASIAAIKAKTDNLPPDPADNSDILGAINNLPSQTADAVWDEPLSGHTGAGTAGRKLEEIKNAQAVVGDVTGVIVY